MSDRLRRAIFKLLGAWKDGEDLDEWLTELDRAMSKEQQGPDGHPIIGGKR